jgi:hypothetical protein
VNENLLNSGQTNVVAELVAHVSIEISATSLVE